MTMLVNRYATFETFIVQTLVKLFLVLKAELLSFFRGNKTVTLQCQSSLRISINLIGNVPNEIRKGFL